MKDQTLSKKNKKQKKTRHSLQKEDTHRHTPNLANHFRVSVTLTESFWSSLSSPCYK